METKDLKPKSTRKPKPSPKPVNPSPNEPLYGEVKVVTSQRLKRSYVNNGYKASFFVPDTNYTQLCIIGLQLGVTWDEALRGLIDMHLASSDTTGGLKNFVPALQ